MKPFVPAALTALLAVASVPAISWAVPAPMSSRYDMPDPALNPGAIDPKVTQANIHQTICVPGYTRTVRPAVSVTNRIKRQQIAAYNYSDRRLEDYELDHLISLELGGSPDDPRNLWPEPHYVTDGWGSFVKDRLENKLHHLVCSDSLPLATAQDLIAHHWIDAYKQYIGPLPQQ